MEVGRWMFGNRIFSVNQNTIDLRKFVSSEIERKKFRRRYDEKLLLSVGRLESQKNHLFLIPVIAEFVKMDPAIQYWICCEESLRKNLEKSITKNELQRIIRLLGNQSDIANLLKQACNVPRLSRTTLQIRADAFLFLFVGEVGPNKNHQVILRAMSMLNNPYIHYTVVECGNQEENLGNLAKKLYLDANFHLLGYDIPVLCRCADVFCFPSRREDLWLAALEAMVSEVLLLSNNIHGINDYSVSEGTGFKHSPNDVAGFSEGIRTLFDNQTQREKIGTHNRQQAMFYSMEHALAKRKEISQVIGLFSEEVAS